MVRCPTGFKKSRTHGCIPKDSRSPGRRAYTKKEGVVYGRKKAMPIKSKSKSKSMSKSKSKSKDEMYHFMLYFFNSNGLEEERKISVRKNHFIADLKEYMEMFENDQEPVPVNYEELETLAKTTMPHRQIFRYRNPDNFYTDIMLTKLP
jgi:hypothetical protein